MEAPMNLKWSQGFRESTAVFIDRNVVCHKCGRSVKFLGAGTERVFLPDCRNVAHLAVHRVNNVFAVAESDILKPKVFIYDYPDFNLLADFDDAAELDISAIAFSSSATMCVASGVPDYQLSLWNYTDGTLLAKTSILDINPTSISINPANWRQICITHESTVHLWTVEQCSELYHLEKTSIKLPPCDAPAGWCQSINSSGLGESGVGLLTRDSTSMSRMTTDLPRATLAGVASQHLEEFEAAQDFVTRVEASSHVWTVLGDIFVGCNEGQLVRLHLDTESPEIIMILNPVIITSALMREGTDMSEAADADEAQLQPNSMRCLALAKNGLYAGGLDGFVRSINLDNDGRVRNIGTVFQSDGSVTTLSFNSAYTALAVSNNVGSVDQVDVLASNLTNTPLFHTHYGDFVGFGLLPPGTETLATVREDGEVQLWSTARGNLVGSLNLSEKCTALCASPLINAVVIGTELGFVYLVDCTNPQSLRVLSRQRLHHTPVLHIGCDSEGLVFITASSDGHTFVLSLRPSRKFEVLGFTDVPGIIQDMAVLYDAMTKKIHVALVSSETADQPNSKITYFELRKELIEDPSQFYHSRRCDFSEDSIRKMDLNFHEPSYGCSISVKGDKISLFSVAETSRLLYRIVLPDEPPKKGGSKASYMSAENTYSKVEMQDPRVQLSATADGSFISISSVEGCVAVVEVDNVATPLSVQAHDFNQGGVRWACFSTDSSSIYTSGFDGSLHCFRFNGNATKLKSGREYKVTFQSDNIGLSKSEGGVMTEMPDKSTELLSFDGSSAETPEPMVEDTWLQIQESVALQEEDHAYAEQKMELRRQLQDIKSQINALVDLNTDLPDLEKLEYHEFELDVDEQARIQAETETEVAKVLEDIEYENLAKQFERDVIIKECWEGMAVKGRSIASFNSAIEVTNYPMKERNKNELQMLEVVTKRRQIELQDLKDRREFAEPRDGAALNDDAEEGEDEENKDSLAIAGTKGALFGGGNDLLYNQFDLYTRNQKINQVVLLQDSLYRIKDNFNKEFDSVYTRKTQEINRIREKNLRIRKIISDLNMGDEVNDPILSTAEDPSRLLYVEDDEVTVEKFLTPEQMKKLEEERQIEQERRRREAADNWRERGLDDMMGGVLEVKKEDELKKDVPKPAFMIQKPEEEWNEDEKKLVAEYERKVKELNEEREKFRKQLDTELKRLTGLIDESKITFDEALDSLFNKKISTQMAIFQEELMILRLKYALLVEEEMNSREKELEDTVEMKTTERQQVVAEVGRAKEVVQKFQEQYDILSAEDKVQEKNFKKDFSDLPTFMVDQLFKLYRRRPRKNIKVETPLAGSISTFDSPNNPYSERPSTARQRSEQRSALEQAMDELDHERNMLEGMDPSIWVRLCKIRRDKFFNEHELRLRALELSEMNAYLQAREDEARRLKSDIDDLTSSVEKLREDKNQYLTNLEVQLLLKQGQVEVDALQGFIHDFTDSLLVHRGVVEEQNAKIRALGEGKLQHMVEGKDFKSKFVHLEWELKMMRMDVEDLRNKAKDIQSFKISREIQRYLSTADYDGLIASEILKIEQAMQLMEKHHEKVINEKTKRLKDLQNNKSKKMDSKNDSLKSDVDELNVVVNERMLINNANSDKRNDGSAAEKRYRQILQRQKLVDLAKAQAKEVAVLRAEVERLRMRTFPALVQNT